MAYYQDGYDKRFIKIVNYLVATRYKHKVFKTQLELSKMLGPGDKGNKISSIMAGSRGVPKDLRDAIDAKLEKLFNLKRNAPAPELELNDEGGGADYLKTPIDSTRISFVQ